MPEIKDGETIVRWQPRMILQGVRDVLAMTEISRLTAKYGDLYRNSPDLAVFKDTYGEEWVVRRGDWIHFNAEGSPCSVSRRETGL